MEDPKTLHWRVEEDFAPLRADVALTRFEQLTSRSQIKKLFDEKKVTINGKFAKPSQELQPGDEVSIQWQEPETESLEPYDFPLDIVFEDEDLLVVNKPAGLVVHPAHGHAKDTLVNALIAHQKTLSAGSSEFRPGLVHRIDKDTSGLLVIAKNEKTHNSLARQFKNKTTHRVYHAVVFGKIKEKSGSMESYIVRSEADRKKFMSSPGPEGKWALTHYEVLREGPHMSFVQLKLDTGRTHQIRVHLSALGHPIVGDDTYGGKNRARGLASQELKNWILNTPRFALHAKELGFTHPRTQERLVFDSLWPEDLQHLLELTHLQENPS